MESVIIFYLSHIGIPRTLTIFVGLNVMLRYNVNFREGLLNGTMGNITKITFGKGIRTEPNHPKDIPEVTIKVKSTNEEKIVKAVTVQFKAVNKNGTIERRMLPMVACYASTVHKLQGATLDQAVIDLGSGYFQPGQKFVALSRVTSLKGIQISAIDPKGLLPDNGMNVCDSTALAKMNQLRNLPPYNQDDSD